MDNRRLARKRAPGVARCYGAPPIHDADARKHRRAARRGLPFSRVSVTSGFPFGVVIGLLRILIEVFANGTLSRTLELPCGILGIGPLLGLTGFRTDGNLSLWDRPNDQLAPIAGSS